MYFQWQVAVLRLWFALKSFSAPSLHALVQAHSTEYWNHSRVCGCRTEPSVSGGENTNVFTFYEIQIYDINLGTGNISHLGTSQFLQDFPTMNLAIYGMLCWDWKTVQSLPSSLSTNKSSRWDIAKWCLLMESLVIIYWVLEWSDPSQRGPMFPSHVYRAPIISQTEYTKGTKVMVGACGRK